MPTGDGAAARLSPASTLTGKGRSRGAVRAAIATARPLLLRVAVAYVGLTLSYTLVWRNVPFLDVFVISGGFLLRAVAGGAAAPVDLSEWFLLVISFAAVLVAGGKRYAELRRTERT